MLNWDAPILAVHILLINLATDTLPALALGVDPASKNIMKNKPVKSGTLFEKGLVVRVVLHGLFITTATICAYKIGLKDSHEVGMTMAFCVLAISQLFHALNQRSNTESIFTTGNGRNLFLFASIVLIHRLSISKLKRISNPACCNPSPKPPAPQKLSIHVYLTI